MSDGRVDAYLAALPEAQRAVLERLRRVIREAAPGAVETIAYDMPAYRQDGRFLVSFGGYKRHCSLFPASDAVIAATGGALDGHLAGRGTIRFTVERPLPDDVVRTIVRTRLVELARGSG